VLDRGDQPAGRGSGFGHQGQVHHGVVGQGHVNQGSVGSCPSEGGGGGQLLVKAWLVDLSTL
jgi:hypothetical protein